MPRGTLRWGSLVSSAMVATMSNPMNAKNTIDATGESENRGQVAGPALGDHGGTDRQFQHQVPADHPGDKLAKGGVGEGVCAARDRKGRGEFGVAQRGERAGGRRDQERYPDGRA